MALLIGAGIATGVAMLGWRLRRFEVEGDSMRPTLDPGDRVIATRARRVRPGELAVLADPRTGRPVVKRVAAAGGAEVTVHGDNPARSTDSRHYGPVALAAVRGRVVYRYAPASRRGFVRPLVP